MQLGFNLPISGPNSAPRSLARLAQEGEALGYDYLTLTDHVVLPDVSSPGYPYSESGEFIANAPAERHELLTATSFIAAKTSRRLVLAVLVVPHRPAVLAAKMLSTIDVLSEGRLVIGIGAGWLKAEFDAVVTTPFAERGAVTDEYLEAFRALRTTHASTAATRSLPTSYFYRARCSNRIRRSGSAVRAAPRCVVPRVLATRGTRSVQTTSTCSTRCHGSQTALHVCAD
jgi:alkanesulfonate monooxygenase SsuD/methylene tetrahydromethanopterin reductase-like flavin-dependent oxidoreductase (luciferase family)